MAVIFDGRKFANKRKEILSYKVKKLKKRGINPMLASMYLPKDFGSTLYTKVKKKEAESLGIKFIPYVINKNNIESIVSEIKKLNNNASVHGILIQKPSGENDFSPTQWMKIVSALSPEKDVDCLTPENLGLITLGTPRFLPATVKAVIEILKNGKVEVKGKRIVILGSSEILGKPLAIYLTEEDATVSLLHTQTKNLGEYTNDADVVISATGKENIISAYMVKEGVIVIDVGSPKGDVQFNEVVKKASFITPVPGGVGPVTVISLLENLLDSDLIKNQKD